MLRFYQGHIIIMLVDGRLSAEVTECRSGAPLPLKVSASLEEGEAILIDRARQLVDLLAKRVTTDRTFTGSRESSSSNPMAVSTTNLTRGTPVQFKSVPAT